MYKVNDELIEVITIHGRTQVILYKIVEDNTHTFAVCIINTKGALLKSGLGFILKETGLNEYPIYKATKLTKAIYGIK